MTKTFAVLVTSMPCEVGAAVMYQCLDEESVVIQMSVNDAKSYEKTVNAINKEIQSPHRLIMIGTYWSSCMMELLKHFDETEVYLYCFGDLMDIQCPNLSQFSGKDGTGPAAYLLELAQDKSGSKNLMKLFVNNFRDVLRYIDDRVYNRNILENQIFYTGLYNYGGEESMTLSLAERFINLFQGNYSMTELMELGKIITSAQLGMARERVKNSSRQVTLQNDVKAVITEGPDLINLTHDALHAKYPDAQVTLVARMIFAVDSGNNPADKLAYSIRSFDKEVNAASLAKKIDGDGNEETGGGRFNHVFPTPF